MEFLNLRTSFDWAAPIWQRVVQSNVLLLDGTGALDVTKPVRPMARRHLEEAVDRFQQARRHDTCSLGWSTD
jgi:hypothetical protein